MLVLITTYLVWIWIVASAASRGQGFVFFAAGLAALGLALLAFRRGRRQVLHRLYYAALVAAVVALLAEAALHLAPGILSGHVANVAYTGYHWHRGGVYTLDPHVGPILLPGVRRPMYWQGHTWMHETNVLGYRGPALTRADVVFLGDSMIYGHGVENEDTVPSQLARLSGLATANLGQQGTSLLQSWMIFERRGVPLRPRRVFVCLHPGDLAETTASYPAEELERLLASPLGSYEPLARPKYRPRARWNPARVWAEELAIPMRVAGVAGAVYRGLRAGQLAPAWRRRGEAERFVPADLDQPLSAPEAPAGSPDRLAWEAQKRALEEVERASERLGARVVAFDLGYPHAFSRAVEALAAESGVLYSPAGRLVLERNLAGEDVYLARDGHWNARGCGLVAGALTPFVR